MDAFLAANGKPRQRVRVGKMGKARGWLLLAGCALLASGSTAFSQNLDPPPLPVPVVAPEPSVLPPPARLVPLTPAPIWESPPPTVLPPKPPPHSFFMEGDQLLERPELPPPGWFFGVEAAWVVPHVKNRLINNVLIDGEQLDTIHVPQAELDSTIAPRFAVGYRLPEGLGEFLFSYRFLVSEGTAFFDGSDAQERVKSRVNLNVFDFDYATRECSLAPKWNMRWLIGVRVAGIYFDSRSDLQTLPEMFAALNLEQRASNNFWGAGPHAGLQLSRNLEIPGMTLFANIEAATLLGRIHQGFSERFSFSGVPNMQFGGATSISGSQAVPTLSFQTGLGWTPPGMSNLRYSFGYEYEHWWSLGKVNGSSAELWDQGLFLRGEINY
jgi:hypothetical protein